MPNNAAKTGTMALSAPTAARVSAWLSVHTEDTSRISVWMDVFKEKETDTLIMNGND